ncbi:MAG: autotransporter-associated beta strand repeat-containing protein [Luteolibacter sp.]
MKPIRNPFASALLRRSVFAASISLAFAMPYANAVTRTKANNTDALSLASSWGGTAVGSVDIGQWTSTVLAANSTVLGADQSWLGISIVSPGGLVTIGAGNTLTLGTSGIAMNAATQDLTFSAGLALAIGNQSWNVQTGRTLTLNTGTFNRATGSTVNLSGVGTISASMVNLTANTAGLVGPWASVGTGTALRYATFAGANIVGYTAATPAADGSALTDTTGLVNYDLASSAGTVPAAVSANTIRYTGAAGTMSVGATAFSVNGLMNAGTGILTLDSGNLTIGSNQELVVNTAGNGLAINSVIQNNLAGDSALTKVGGGTLTLSGINNSYTGVTTINGGAVDVGDFANLSLGGGGVLFSSDAVLQGNGTFTRNFTTGTTLTAAAGEIAGFTGGFAARGGPLVVNFGGSSATFTISGLSPRFGNNFVFGSSTANNKVTVENPINLNGASRSITVNSGLGGDYAEFSGLLSGSATSGLTKNGAGRLVLSALNNTYAGTTTINNGTLEVGLISNNSLGTNGLLFTGGVLQGNGTFTRNFSGTATAGNGEIAGLTGGFSAKDGPLTVNFGGIGASVGLSGVTTTPKLGSGFTLGSATANNKVTVVNPIALNGAQRTFTVPTGAGGDSAELSGQLSGGTTSGVSKVGTGLLLLSASNDYAGATTVGAGILAISNGNALGFAAAGVTNNTSVTSGASLQLTGGITADPTEPLTISGTGATNVGALQAGTGGGTWAGPITLGAVTARVGATAGNTLTITGSIASGTTTGISISGGSGTGVVVLNPTSPNTYTGQTNLVRGTLRLGKNDALPVTTVIEAKDQANSPDATGFDLAGFNQTIAGLLDSGTPVNTVISNSVAATTSTLTINNSTFQTYDALIVNGAGTVALTKEGTGTETLTGVNTYTGPTTVNGGTLRVNGAGSLAAGSAVTVGGSGTLAGTGTILGSVTALGTIAPGTGATGTLTAGTTTLSGTLAVEIDGANGDKLVSSGMLNLSGPLTVTLLAGGFTQSSYVIAEGSSLTGTFSSVPSGYTVTYTPTQAILSQGAVDPYTTWINSPAFNTPALTTAQKLPTADPDSDGTPNFLEFALNGNPVSGSSNGLIASLVQDASLPAGKELTLVCAVRDGAVFTAGVATVSGLTYTVEGSLNLAFPTSPVSSTGPSNTAPASTGLPDLTGTDWEYHTFKLDASEGLGGKGFLRLKVTQP